VHISKSHNAPQPKRTKTPEVIAWSLSVGCSIVAVRLQRISCRQSATVSAGAHTCRRRKTWDVDVPRPWWVDSHPAGTAEQDHVMTCKQALPIWSWFYVSQATNQWSLLFKKSTLLELGRVRHRFPTHLRGTVKIEQSNVIVIVNKFIAPFGRYAKPSQLYIVESWMIIFREPIRQIRRTSASNKAASAAWAKSWNVPSEPAGQRTPAWLKAEWPTTCAVHLGISRAPQQGSLVFLATNNDISYTVPVTYFSC